jgi:hypothetical protein
MTVRASSVFIRIASMTTLSVGARLASGASSAWFSIGCTQT